MANQWNVLATLIVLNFTIVILIFMLVIPSTLKQAFIGEVINRYGDTEYAITLAKLCNMGKDDLAKVYCVHSHFSRFFEYKDYEKGWLNNSLFILPEAILRDGGNCVDASWFYCAIFRDMGIECNVIYSKDMNHRFNIITLKNRYCVIDQTFIDCSYTV